MPAPKPSILGIKEAKVVSEWTRKRARGERVPIEPPSMQADGSVVVTARMGRIDSPRPAARWPRSMPTRLPRRRLPSRRPQRSSRRRPIRRLPPSGCESSPASPAEAPAEPVVQPTVTETSSVQPADDGAGTGVLSNVRKKLGNLFGG